MKKAPLESLNKPYYIADSKLRKNSAKYHGIWDVEFGFNYKNLSINSSQDILEASYFESPFLEYYKKFVIPYISKISPNILGLSITVPGQLIPTFQLCRMIRESGYDGKIIVGGNTVTRVGLQKLSDRI